MRSRHLLCLGCLFITVATGAVEPEILPIAPAPFGPADGWVRVQDTPGEFLLLPLPGHTQSFEVGGRRFVLGGWAMVEETPDGLAIVEESIGRHWWWPQVVDDKVWMLELDRKKRCRMLRLDPADWSIEESRPISSPMMVRCTGFDAKGYWRLEGYQHGPNLGAKSGHMAIARVALPDHQVVFRYVVGETDPTTLGMEPRHPDNGPVFPQAERLVLDPAARGSITWFASDGKMLWMRVIYQGELLPHDGVKNYRDILVRVALADGDVRHLGWGEYHPRFDPIHLPDRLLWLRPSGRHGLGQPFILTELRKDALDEPVERELPVSRITDLRHQDGFLWVFDRDAAEFDPPRPEVRVFALDDLREVPLSQAGDMPANPPTFIQAKQRPYWKMHARTADRTWLIAYPDRVACLPDEGRPVGWNLDRLLDGRTSCGGVTARDSRAWTFAGDHLVLLDPQNQSVVVRRIIQGERPKYGYPHLLQAGTDRVWFTTHRQGGKSGWCTPDLAKETVIEGHHTGFVLDDSLYCLDTKDPYRIDGASGKVVALTKLKAALAGWARKKVWGKWTEDQAYMCWGRTQVVHREDDGRMRIYLRVPCSPVRRRAGPGELAEWTRDPATGDWAVELLPSTYTPMVQGTPYLYDHTERVLIERIDGSWQPTRSLRRLPIQAGAYSLATQGHLYTQMTIGIHRVAWDELEEIEPN